MQNITLNNGIDPQIISIFDFSLNDEDAQQMRALDKQHRFSTFYAA